MNGTTAIRVTLATDTLSVDLADCRSISAPLAWYLRLLHGTPEEFKHHATPDPTIDTQNDVRAGAWYNLRSSDAQSAP
jgi:hypothetical protein